ncbi:MAG: ATPase [Euryarchaeota archaeon]|nr:ATPase [Euryarchaeota archaeon]MBV1754689.1 ATPase [Methanobacterium sp.]MBV1768111.1 ATPase [Methanobacterium sp.]
MPEKKEILVFLKRIGVDTRFVSVVYPRLYINNLRFSRFSRKKEELFLKNYPSGKVIRSSLFQKICARSSRILGESLRPQEKVMINSDLTLENKALYIILEPYTRKYGIQIIKSDLKLQDINEYSDYDFNSLALPLTLDGEVEGVLARIFTGEKIELQSSETKRGKVRLIYPLLNIPQMWLEDWLNPENSALSGDGEEEISHEFLLFLEGVVPQVRENILKSSQFLTKNIS